MNLTQDQVAFAQNMTSRQRDVLRALAYAGPFVMSASERGDAELYALVRAKLAHCGRFRSAGSEFFTWDATPSGKAASRVYYNVVHWLDFGTSVAKTRTKKAAAVLLPN